MILPAKSNYSTSCLQKVRDSTITVKKQKKKIRTVEKSKIPKMSHTLLFTCLTHHVKCFVWYSPWLSLRVRCLCHHSDWRPAQSRSSTPPCSHVTSCFPHQGIFWLCHNIHAKWNQMLQKNHNSWRYIAYIHILSAVLINLHLLFRYCAFSISLMWKWWRSRKES